MKQPIEGRTQPTSDDYDNDNWMEGYNDGDLLSAGIEPRYLGEAATDEQVGRMNAAQAARGIPLENRYLPCGQKVLPNGRKQYRQIGEYPDPLGRTYANGEVAMVRVFEPDTHYERLFDADFGRWETSSRKTIYLGQPKAMVPEYGARAGALEQSRQAWERKDDPEHRAKVSAEMVRNGHEPLSDEQGLVSGGPLGRVITGELPLAEWRDMQPKTASAPTDQLAFMQSLRPKGWDKVVPNYISDHPLNPYETGFYPNELEDK